MDTQKKYCEKCGHIINVHNRSKDNTEICWLCDGDKKRVMYHDYITTVMSYAQDYLDAHPYANGLDEEGIELVYQQTLKTMLNDWTEDALRKSIEDGSWPENEKTFPKLLAEHLN